MKEEQIRYYTQTVWGDGTIIHYEQGAPRRSAMIPQGWEVINGMLKPTDRLSPKKKKITHKMGMT